MTGFPGLDQGISGRRSVAGFPGCGIRPPEAWSHAVLQARHGLDGRCPVTEKQRCGDVPPRRQPPPPKKLPASQRTQNRTEAT